MEEIKETERCIKGLEGNIVNIYKVFEALCVLLLITCYLFIFTVLKLLEFNENLLESNAVHIMAVMTCIEVTITLLIYAIYKMLYKALILKVVDNSSEGIELVDSRETLDIEKVSSFRYLVKLEILGIGRETVLVSEKMLAKLSITSKLPFKIIELH